MSGDKLQCMTKMKTGAENKNQEIKTEGWYE